MNDDHENILVNTFFEELDNVRDVRVFRFFPMRKPKTWTWIRGGHVHDVRDVRVLDLAVEDG